MTFTAATARCIVAALRSHPDASARALADEVDRALSLDAGHRRCTATTEHGYQCPFTARANSDRCGIHARKARRKRTPAPAPVVKRARPAKPAPVVEVAPAAPPVAAVPPRRKHGGLGVAEEIFTPRPTPRPVRILDGSDAARGTARPAPRSASLVAPARPAGSVPW